jgi:hypothetical protein
MGLQARWLFVGALMAAPRITLAHGPQRPPSAAVFQNPVGVGNFADQQYKFSWVDGEAAPVTSTTTIDIYYVSQNPPTYVVGTLVVTPHSHLLRGDVRLNDPSNVVAWDTSNVPSGTYWLWSAVTEIPVSNPEHLITFSPGVVSIVHPGDEAQPAVVLVPPPDAFLWPVGYMLDVDYMAFDPHGTGTITIEATQSPDGSDMRVLASGLPASMPGDSTYEGHFTWDTHDVPTGRWTLRATIQDARGMTFSAYDQVFYYVNHPPASSHGGCACVSSANRAPWAFGFIGVVFFGLVFFKRSRSPNSSR